MNIESRQMSSSLDSPTQSVCLFLSEPTGQQAAPLSLSRLACTRFAGAQFVSQIASSPEGAPSSAARRKCSSSLAALLLLLLLSLLASSCLCLPACFRPLACLFPSVKILPKLALSRWALSSGQTSAIIVLNSLQLEFSRSLARSLARSRLRVDSKQCRPNVIRWAPYKLAQWPRARTRSCGPARAGWRRWWWTSRRRRSLSWASGGGGGWQTRAPRKRRPTLRHEKCAPGRASGQVDKIHKQARA